MPKEWTHIIVSREAAQKVKGLDETAAAILEKRQDLFMIGAIICDTSYYHTPLFNKDKDVSFISKKIHNDRGELDGAFMRRLASSARHLPEEEHFAFFCGILSHAIADRVFHPLVLYLTGDYHAEGREEREMSQARHRFLEGLIDLKLAGREGGTCHMSDWRDLSYRKRNELLPLIIAFVTAADPAGSEERSRNVAKIVCRLLKKQLFLLKLYEKGYFRRMVLEINRLANFRFSGYAAMLYPEKRQSDRLFLKGELNYKDPFTGAEMRDTIRGLKDKAIDDLSSAIISYRNSGELAQGIEGPCPLPGSPRFTDTGETGRDLDLFLGRKGDR